MSCGMHIGQEPEPAAIDAEQRHAVPGHQARRVEQGAVPADGDDEVGAGAELRLGDAGHA